MSQPEFVTCKHCGRFLSEDDMFEALRRGFDSNECANEVRCTADTDGIESTVHRARCDLSVLADKWALADANAKLAALEAADAADDEDLNTDAALTGDDLFSREVRASSALW